MFLFKKIIKNDPNTLFSSLNSSRGQSSIYIVIIIMVIIFAVMFVGGVESLSSGNEASPVSITPSAADSGTASPAAGSASPTASTSPTATTAPATWTLDVIPGACEGLTKAKFKKFQVAINGNSKGYIAVSQLKGSSYEVYGTSEFSPPLQNYTMSLLSDLQFDTKPWKITIFSGGTKNGENWVGGSTQKIYDGQPTGCN